MFSCGRACVSVCVGGDVSFSCVNPVARKEHGSLCPSAGAARSFHSAWHRAPRARTHTRTQRLPRRVPVARRGTFGRGLTRTPGPSAVPSPPTPGKRPGVPFRLSPNLLPMRSSSCWPWWSRSPRAPSPFATARVTFRYNPGRRAAVPGGPPRPGPVYLGGCGLCAPTRVKRGCRGHCRFLLCAFQGGGKKKKHVRRKAERRTVAFLLFTAVSPPPARSVPCR